jgi:hypothetical protein
MTRTLIFDIPKIQALNDHYQQALDQVKEMLPQGLTPSTAINYFYNIYWIKLPNIRIATLTAIIKDLDTNTELFSDLAGLIEYLKLKYIIKNYTSCVLRHHHEGHVNLRLEKGIWVMPNKQPIPSLNHAVLACLKGEKLWEQ